MEEERVKKVASNASNVSIDMTRHHSGTSSSSFTSPSDCSRLFPTPKSRPADYCPPSQCSPLTTSTSSSSTVSMDVFKSDCKDDGGNAMSNMAYKTAIAKAILKQYSPISGDNLYEHLSDIIKRVIDERPPNVIDFFEEFSRNVREKKYHLPESYTPVGIGEESKLYLLAKQLLRSMRLPVHEEVELPVDDEALEENTDKSMQELDLRLELMETTRLFVSFNERVQHLQFYWSQCGFSINSDDIFLLAMSMDRLQTHPSIMQCRFWGEICGLKASYYVVEASLTRDQILERNDQMERDWREKYPLRLPVKPEDRVLPPEIGPQFKPGAVGWETWPREDIAKMQPPAEMIPLVNEVEELECPPERVGEGLNRFSYFVVNKFSDDWIELPVITPKLINSSRLIKKFFTGNLEADILSWPCFPGKEKHYLRALIARITAGTFIAPEGYYRKMTKKERRLYEGFEEDEMEEEEESEEESVGDGEDEGIDNDIMLLKNEKYKQLPVNMLASLSNWIHVRPHILKQGRVVWIDEEKVRRDREKELQRYIKRMMLEEMGMEEDEEEEQGEEEGDEEEEGSLENLLQPEIGPPIFHPIYHDTNAEFTVPWTSRLTSKYTHDNERAIVMRSNNWPGAFTFAFENVCESIYMGYGHKYISRNIPFKHLQAMLKESPHNISDYNEATDPTPAEEEAYRLWLIKKQTPPDDGGEEMGEFTDNESGTGTEDEDDDDDE